MSYRVLKRFESVRFGSRKVGDILENVSDSIAEKLTETGHLEKVKAAVKKEEVKAAVKPKAKATKKAK